jgi:hypothetical protein
MMKNVWILALSLGLSACSFESNHGSQNEQRENEDRDSLIRAYSSIQGTYEGTLQTATKTLEARLTLTYKEVVVGRDSEGQPRYRPVLVARLSRPDLLTLDVRLEGRFVPETGDLTLTTQSKADENGNARIVGEDLYLRSSIRNGELRAVVKTNGHDYGILNVRFSSRDVRSESIDDAEQMDRIRRRMQKIAGVYEGTATPDDVMGPFRFRMRIAIEESAGFPTLVVFYTRDQATVPVRMVVTYRPDRSPEEISFTNTDSTHERVSFYGHYSNGMIDGILTYPTFRAEMRAVRR